MFDIATLTGACVVALGYDYTAVVSPDDDLANKLLKAAKATDDRAWRLPWYEEMKGCMKSQIADVKNISNQRGAGGTITASEFLRQFTGDVPWGSFGYCGNCFCREIFTSLFL